MDTTGLESSDVDSVVKWNELYDKWWEDFHLNAGHTEPDLATSIIKKVNHHAHEGYDKMKRVLDQHVAVRKKNWDDIRRVVDIDQVYEDWWKEYHAGGKKAEASWRTNAVWALSPKRPKLAVLRQTSVAMSSSDRTEAKP